MTKKEQAQTELFKTDVSWFHVFKELIRSGTWAKLSSNSKSLYPVIKAFINHENGSAFPSLDTLQEYSGLARASVVKALKELEAEGLLIKTSGNRTTSNNYSVIEKFDVKDGEGRPTASVSFDYLPAYVTDAVAELKNFMAQGLTLPDGKTNFIKIENLTLNINHAGSTQNNTTNNIQNVITPEEAIQGMKDVLAHKDTSAARAINGLINKNEGSKQ